MRTALLGTVFVFNSFAVGVQSAHVHGEVSLQLITENKQLSVLLSSPLINIVGFEHQPARPEDKWRLNNAVAELKKAHWLLLNDGGCALQSTGVRYSWQEEGLNSSHHNEHEHHDEHKHHDEHAEVSITYYYQCTEPQPESLQVKLHALFPGIEKIQLQWITDEGQGAATLDSSERIVEF